jgi:hypothetical protein
MNHKNQHIEPFITKKKLKSVLVIILVVSIFIGFLSPFGMSGLPLYKSIFYWLVTCTIGYMIYMPTIYYGNQLLKNVVAIQWLRIIIAGLIASILMSLTLPLINGLFFNNLVNYTSQFWSLLPKTIVIGGFLTFINLMQGHVKRQKEELITQQKLNEEYQQQSEQTKNSGLEQFLTLLPVNKRGDLYCLEMADHYVKVYTSEGHHLLLMRFKDALTQLAEFDGLQTHRSWWVANSAITSVKKDGRKTSLIMKNNLEVPVSRTYLNDVKAAAIH